MGCLLEPCHKKNKGFTARLMSTWTPLLTSCLSGASWPQVLSLPICKSWVFILCSEKLLWEIYMRNTWNLSTQYVCATVSRRKMWGCLYILCLYFYFENCMLKNVSIISDMRQNDRIWKVKIEPKRSGSKKQHSHTACFLFANLLLEALNENGARAQMCPSVVLSP